MFAGSLCAPDDAGGSAGGVEAGVRTVALVGGAELAMSLGALLWRVRSSIREAEMVGEQGRLTIVGQPFARGGSPSGRAQDAHATAGEGHSGGELMFVESTARLCRYWQGV